jgi:hypothetical protein
MGRRRWFVWLILAALSLCLPAAAQAKSVFLNPSLFGTLNQQNPIITAVWGNNGCPPTSAVNTFVYLQKNYPSVYGTYLVANYSVTTMANTAVTVGGPDYLNGYFDTTWRWFYRDYLWGTYLYMHAVIDNLAPQTWKSGIPMYWDWDWTLDRPCPNWASFNPIFIKSDEIYNALSASKAVVIEWTGITIESDGSISQNGHRHYMTVTGLAWNDHSNTGTLYYIDPKGGLVRNSPMWIGTNGLLWIDYGETNGVPWPGSTGNWWYSGIAEIIFAMSVGPTGVAPLQPARHGAVPYSILLHQD